MHSSYPSQSGVLIDNACFLDAFHKDGEDSCVDKGCGAAAHSDLTAVMPAVQEREICFVKFL